MKRFNRSYLKVLLASIAIIVGSVSTAFSANVTLRWDANVPAPEGYRVFAREDSQSHNYDHPLWEDSKTTCTLTGLSEGVTYHFVVRAFDGALESADSEEVSYTPDFMGPNLEPTADAGPNQSVYENTAVTLDGSGSSDSDGSIASYLWKQTAGTKITIENAGNQRASFNAPIVGPIGDALMFSLTVTDDDGSQSVSHTTVSVIKSSGTDSDGDQVPDILDQFPNDPDEWADNDHDGTGNNQDADDDNDGMSDTWETEYGLNPFEDDADLDSDGDGQTNLEEFKSDTNPIADPGNSAPDAPSIDTPAQTDRIDLTPVLVSGAFFDTDYDDHLQSQWQISTQTDFSTLILDETSNTQLTAYTVGEMVLDVDTQYYWRVRFVDSHHGASDWSQVAAFSTIAAHSSEDKDANGIPDSQEVGDTVDVNGNGTPDCQEDNIMTVNTVEGQSILGVKVISENATLVSTKSIPCNQIEDQSVKMGFGLIGFKVYLHNGVKTATVEIHFSKQVSDDAKLYKHITDTGWSTYENAVFAPDGKSVIMILEDGGMGDEDGVENGVIVDPSGISYTEPSATVTAPVSAGDAGAGGGGGGCFISAGTHGLNATGSTFSYAAILMAMIILAAKAIKTGVFSLKTK